MTVIKGMGAEPTMVSRVHDLLASFFELPPQSGDEAQYKAVLALFPDIPAASAPLLIDSVQRTLKREFVSQGLMIGEFHPMNETPGLHNSDFHPLQSPVPMLAIRYMVESDLPFLMRSEDAAPFRVQYLTSYLKRVGEQLGAARRRVAEDALAIAISEVDDAP